MRRTAPRVRIALLCGALIATAPLASQSAPSAAGTNPGPGQALRLTLDSAVILAVRGATPVLLAQDASRLSGIVVLQRYGRFLPDLGASTG